VSNEQDQTKARIAVKPEKADQIQTATYRQQRPTKQNFHRPLQFPQMRQLFREAHTEHLLGSHSH
jgi:hypothetical protein